MGSSNLKLDSSYLKLRSLFKDSWMNLKKWNKQFLSDELVVYFQLRLLNLFYFFFFRFIWFFTIHWLNWFFDLFNCQICWIRRRNLWLIRRSVRPNCIFRFYFLFLCCKILAVFIIIYDLMLYFFLFWFLLFRMKFY